MASPSYASSSADIYALREFLHHHYEKDPSYTYVHPNLALIIQRKPRYIFTIVDGFESNPFFYFRKKKMFSKIDLAQFSLSGINMSMSLAPIPTMNTRDKKEVNGLISLLQERPYGQLIPNLEKLAI